MESWRNRKTLILSRTEMMGLLTPAEYNACVEQAYRMHGERRFYMDPKGHIVLDKYPGEWEAMPSYIEEPEAAACKWVSIRERNREKYRSAHGLLDPDLHPSRDRLSARHLRRQPSHGHAHRRRPPRSRPNGMARKNSKVLAIVGAGHMAAGVLATCNEVFPWEEVRVWSRSQATLDDFVTEQQPKYPQLPSCCLARPREAWSRRRRGRHRHAGARSRS